MGKLFGASWQTTVLGVAAILKAVITAAVALANGAQPDYNNLVTEIVLGIGLM